MPYQLAAVGTNALLHAAESRAKSLQAQCERLENEAQSLRREKLQAETTSNMTIQSMQKRVTNLEDELDKVRRSEDQVGEVNLKNNQHFHSQSMMRLEYTDKALIWRPILSNQQAIGGCDGGDL